MTTKTLPNIIVKYRGLPLLAADRKRCPRTHHTEADPRRSDSAPDGPTSELFVRNGYRAVVCHHEPYTDNCGSCAPLWGVMAVKVNP